MTIDIWSDISCPFCYLGKRHLELALERLQLQDQVQVVWHSFQLDPDLQTDTSISLYDYLAREKGWPRRDVEAINARLNTSGAQAGIAFHFDRVVVANTYRAHALLQAARLQNKQQEVGARLFQAYFGTGKNVDDVQVLVTLAREAGMDTAGLREALERDAYAESIRSDLTEASRLGIGAVPHFIFNGTQSISGAQPVPVFEEALKKARGH
ncbi:MAG: DsbA family oxidoreductase [Bacteroidota bacterium]